VGGDRRGLIDKELGDARVTGIEKRQADSVSDASPGAMELDVTMPSAARLYDYYLGGHHNFAADRRLARRIYEIVPETPYLARMNREFLRRAVRYLAHQGVRQFIDIGCGLPTVGPVHGIAQSIAPESRVVYVDNEPVAVAHSKILLRDNDQAVVLQADLRCPETILDNHATRRLIDFDEPVAILMVAVLHFVSDDHDPVGLLEHYRRRLKAADYLVFSHIDKKPSCGFLRAAALYENTQNPIYLRSRDEIDKMLSGFSLVDPGLVYVPAWRPECPEDAEDAAACPVYGAVGEVTAT
jgi:SAM-dependent methyltransferase